MRSYAKLTLLIVADALTLTAAMATAVYLRFDDMRLNQIYRMYVSRHALTLVAGLAMYLFVFSLLRLYRYAWRFAGMETLWGIFCANTIGMVGLIALQLVFDRGTLPRSVLIIYYAISILLVGMVRIILRLLSISMQLRQSGRLTKADPKRVLILGGTEHADLILKAIHREWGSRSKVIGFLDDNPRRVGKYIGRVKILGPLKNISDMLAKGMVDEAVVALPNTIGEEIRECILECRDKEVAVKAIPQLEKVLNGKPFLQPADFSVEYLLHRPPVTIDYSNTCGYISNKRVLVTGAGGSIGSELCRQIINLNPSMLILLGHGENSIYNICQELQRDYPKFSTRIRCVIASVCNEARVSEAFECMRPEIVFHASAHKHVPIMESNIKEAICNNVLGTHTVAMACALAGVQRMVLISTDKAADPSSVMGATKWLCEETARSLAYSFPSVGYISVRFGNVLGSRGSVVPLFQKQIRGGGPVTVTHPEMTRYFMTIPEAVQLVLHAGAAGKSGALYLLDMGKPVRMLDMAKDMIRLSGFEPGIDIPIRFTGIRPGERLHEQLISSREKIERVANENLYVIHRPEYYAPAETEEILRHLKHLVDHEAEDEVKDYLYKVVPGFAEASKIEEKPMSANAIAA
jgi:FlaA1/EpsC-like NDP-sugar epimerase